ncbi:hypothetical protein POM88_038831 [Heracleum sosnowskyi]|uniref:RING-type E3 ubiquitin transferase n=1 Tax=Heracleum sosnowskyi TaxID=360622 RepID=A0AAD8M5W4_9APIA|nr:hypothetical protein POM88_038831 [Heracleum sosnowskyi]
MSSLKERFPPREQHQAIAKPPAEQTSQAFQVIQVKYARRSVDTMTPTELSFVSAESDINLSSSPQKDDLEAEMRRFKLELKQTMDMYSIACKEALTTKQKEMELQCWKMEEEQRLEEARLAEEKALALAEREKAKSKASIEHTEAVQSLAENEAQKRIVAEMKAFKESEEKNKT